MMATVTANARSAQCSFLATAPSTPDRPWDQSHSGAACGPDPSLSIDDRLQQIDWRPIAFKLTDRTHGLGWSIERATRAIRGYLQFLKAIDQHPTAALVPSQDVDEVWHCHLLDTHKYAADCQWLFGRFIHHNPYLGMGSPEQAAQLTTAWQETQQLLGLLGQTEPLSSPSPSGDWLGDRPSTCVLSWQDPGDRPSVCSLSWQDPGDRPSAAIEIQLD